MLNFLSVFADPKEDTKLEKKAIQYYVELIEKFFESRGIDPSHKKINGGVVFEKSKGSAGFYIELKRNPKYKSDTIRFTAPIVKLPKRNQEKFFKHCLQLNNDMLCCSLAISGDILQVVSERDLIGLDLVEFTTMLYDIAASADALDDLLSKQFGAEIIALGHAKITPKPVAKLDQIR